MNFHWHFREDFKFRGVKPRENDIPFTVKYTQLPIEAILMAS